MIVSAAATVTDGRALPSRSGQSRTHVSAANRSRGKERIGKAADTLFQRIALGTVELQKQGYTRKGSEAVVGPMPPFGETIKTDDDLWKIIAWMRSVGALQPASGRMLTSTSRFGRRYLRRRANNGSLSRFVSIAYQWPPPLPMKGRA